MVPFDIPYETSHTDIVLRSNDAKPVDLRAHRCVLSSASSFFSTMFSLPQPPSSDPSPSPVVEMSEGAALLRPLLQFIYPVPDPIITTLDELVPLMGTAAKYDMTGVLSRLRASLVTPTFLEKEPVRVFAIASRFDLEEEAKIASSQTLRINVLDSPLCDDLKYITAHSFIRLLNLHRRRAEAAQEALIITDEVKCMHCNGRGAYTSFALPRWWIEFRDRAKEELRVRPTSDVIFSMAFLAGVAQASDCQRCPASILDSHAFLEALKAKIDALPSTI